MRDILKWLKVAQIAYNMCILALLESLLGCHVFVHVFFPAARGVLRMSLKSFVHNFKYLNTVL